MLQFDHASYKNHEDSLVVGISLLTRYEHMGMLDVACSQGCTCNSSAFDTCNPNMAWSEVRWAFHPIQVGKVVEIFLGSQLLTDIAAYSWLLL